MLPAQVPNSAPESLETGAQEPDSTPAETTPAELGQPEGAAAAVTLEDDAAPAGTAAAKDSSEAQGAPDALGLDSLDGPAQAPPVSRFEANIEFDRLVEAEDFQAAAAIGPRWVELTEQEFGPESVETGNAYVGLAEVQTKTGDYAAAEENFLLAVEVFRNADGIYSEDLIRPLTGLGDSYQLDDEFLNAVSAYNEARTVSRRVFGLLNKDQIVLLDRMTRSFVSMGEYLEAEQHQREALLIVERNHPPYAVEVLEAIYKYAAWLRSNRRFSAEREQYARAARLIREHYGDEHPLMAKPLQETGNSFRVQGAAVGQGISGLRQALELLEAAPERDAYALAEVLRDIGDWQTAFAKLNPSLEEYRRSWTLLGELPNGDEIREDWFGGIDYVFREVLSQRGLSADPTAADGFVLVRFDLDPTGHTRNVQVLESKPAGFKDDAVERHVRLSRFRPHMENGVPVMARNLALQITFRYLDNEAP